MDKISWLKLLVLIAATLSAESLRVVDLTHDFGPQSLYWPGNPPLNFTILNRGNTSGGYWLETNAFFTAEHGGTHVDSPSHFWEGGWRVDDIPVSSLAGPAVVVNVKAKVQQNVDYQLAVSDLEAWEEIHGRIPPKSIVIMNSGWGPRYPDPSLTFNTTTPTLPATFHFPGFHPDATTFLTSQRDVIAIGVDTPSTDHGQSVTFETHIILGQHNALGLENLANLDSLPPKGSTVMIGLIKLVDGSGGPARILGLVGDGTDIFDGDTSKGSRLAVADVLLVLANVGVGLWMWKVWLRVEGE